MEDQFNALLYLGPPSSMTEAPMPAALCQDAQFVKTRLAPARPLRAAPGNRQLQEGLRTLTHSPVEGNKLALFRHLSIE
jgi:hypothetical protein